MKSILEAMQVLRLFYMRKFMMETHLGANSLLFSGHNLPPTGIKEPGREAGHSRSEDKNSSAYISTHPTCLHCVMTN